jgi:hypothetical protein
MSVWAPISSEAQLITPRQTDRWSESIKLLQICSVLVFRRMVQNGTTPATSRVFVQQQLSGEYKMSPFEALYGRPCRTSLSWSESSERVIFGPDIVTEVEEKVKQIQANILAAQSRQKNYTDKRRSPLKFEVGDHVYLRVSPMKGVRHFGIKGKLAPRYIVPYPIIDKYGPTSYQVELPVRLTGVHNVFHVSQLKRCLKPSTDVVIEDTIPLKLDLTYKTYLIKILDQQDRVTRNKTTRFYKIQ